MTESIAYTALRLFFTFLLKIFYRCLVTVGQQHLLKTKDAPVVFAATHPNGLVDPLLIMATCGRSLSFVAKHTLFAMPLVGTALRMLGAIAVHRRSDQPNPTTNQNTDSISAMANCLRDGGAITIFPEGISHNESTLQLLRTGFARAVAEAFSSEQNKPKVVYIVPVGLIYTNKERFRSDVCVEYGEPIAVTASMVDVETLRQQLTEKLSDISLVAKSTHHIELMALTRELLSLHRKGDPGNYADEMRSFLRVYVRNADKPDVIEISQRVQAYHEKLQLMCMQDSDVVNARKSFKVLTTIVRVFFSVCVLFPLGLPGIIIQAPVALLTTWIAARLAKGDRDQIAHYRLLLGTVLSFVFLGAFFLVVGLMFGVTISLFCTMIVILCGMYNIMVRPFTVTWTAIRIQAAVLLTNVNLLQQERLKLVADIRTLATKYLE